MITLFKDPFFDVFNAAFDTSVYNKLPEISVRRNENEYKLLMSVPGLTKNDIKIKVNDGYLTISYQKEDKDDNIHFIGSFKKTYSLPEDVKEEEIKGKVENGILELSLPLKLNKPIERLISLN
jgi:HSP20 family protein